MLQVHVVSFYRRTDGAGDNPLTRVDQIEVPTTTVEQGAAAIAIAIAEFERKHDVDDWRKLADHYRLKAAKRSDAAPES